MTAKVYLSPEVSLTNDLDDVILTSGFDTPDDNFGDDSDEGVETPIIPSNPAIADAFEL